MRTILGWLAFLLAALAGWTAPAAARALPAVAPVVSCQSLVGFDPKLDGYPTRITDAREADGMCRVQGVIAPANRFEVRLPLAGWTQRYLQTGCGGLCGNLNIRAPQRDCPALQRGEFVLASTDMGHQGQSSEWGPDRQKRVDFGYRGVHATALVAKALVARFYGQAPRYSYFSGCSDGGREALMEAQRYPQDFDGIAAGAPAMQFLIQNTIHHGWQARSVAPDGKSSVLLPADMPVLHAAAVAACDAKDGVKDGLISDPFGCRFDARTVECKAGQTTGCLTHAAVIAAAAVYAGAHDAQGRKLVPGGLMPGGELGWPGVAVPGGPRGPGGPGRGGPGGAQGQGGPPGPGTPQAGAPVGFGNEGAGLPGSTHFAADVIPWLAYPEPLAPGWTMADFRFDAASLDALRAMHGIYDATDPDLSRYAARGGKILMWHGLQDQHISPANTVAYAEAVADTMGATRAAQVLRTFLIPGMYHCGSGDGLTSIDVLTPLMAWVEDGGAPDRVVASRNDADAAAGRGRPVFAWPATAALTAGADPEQPASWTRGPAGTVPPKLYADWLGADFYKPGFRRDCRMENGKWVCKPAA